MAKWRRFREWGATVLCGSILLLWAPVGALTESEHLKRTTINGEIDWSTRVATARGLGLPPNRATNPLQAKELAREAAWIVAQSNLLEVIKGIHIDSTTTVENFVTTNAVKRATVEGFIKRSRVVKEEVREGGAVEITVAMKLGEEFTSNVSSSPRSAPILLAPPTNKPINFTGVVINAKGLGVHPALDARILNEDGKEVYSMPHVARQTQASKDGMVLYTTDLPSAQLHPRVTKKPFVVQAVRANGPNLIIKNADAETLHATLYELLHQAKVVFIIDPDW